MSMPNRLQQNWPQMKPRILQKWEQLAEADLANVDGQFDRLIDTIRRRYKPGRSPISVEAKIYDWLLHELDCLEEAQEKERER